MTISIAVKLSLTFAYAVTMTPGSRSITLLGFVVRELNSGEDKSTMNPRLWLLLVLPAASLQLAFHLWLP